VLAVIASDDLFYRVLFLLHILSVLVAFAPAFVWPIVNAQTRRTGEKVPSGIAGLAARNTMTIHGPALVLAGLFGLLMVVTSDEVWTFSQTWVSLAFLVWFALLGVVFGLIFPTEKKIAAGDEAAERKMGMFGGIAHTLLLVMLILMIWKPGL
jgi:uncharacterized membrane protein